MAKQRQLKDFLFVVAAAAAPSLFSISIQETFL
jgi:hypothetical protein